MSATAIKILLFVIILLVAAAGGGGLVFHFEQAKIAKLNDSIGQYQAQNADLTAATAKQNAAIAKLQADSNARAQAAQQAISSAKTVAIAKDTQAQQTLLESLPTGSNACDAASKAFDDELRVERGIK